MRDGFREIVDGWENDRDETEIEFRVRRAAVWLTDNQPAESDESERLGEIIERGIEIATKRIVRSYLRSAGILS